MKVVDLVEINKKYSIVVGINNSTIILQRINTKGKCDFNLSHIFKIDKSIIKPTKLKSHCNKKVYNQFRKFIIQNNKKFYFDYTNGKYSVPPKLQKQYNYIRY